MGVMAMTQNKNITICPTCGQKIVNYKHNLNKTLVSCLWNLFQAGGCSRLDKLKLDNTQFTNFQKLRYFHLVVSTGSHSEWQITKEGNDFLKGLCKMPKYVITRNALVVERSIEQVFVDEIKECVSFKIDWKEQAMQKGLFD